MIGPWSEAGSLWGTMYFPVSTLIVMASCLKTTGALADTAGGTGDFAAWMEEI
jgi:hypothetical protein